METKEAITNYLEAIEKGLKEDAQSKDQRMPQDFEIKADNLSGQLYAAHYLKYLIYGRGPGKQPPSENILEWVLKNPETTHWTPEEQNSLAYLIGRKIGEEGTDIWQGKKPGIDLLGVMETNMPSLLNELGDNIVTKFQTSLNNTLK